MPRRSARGRKNTDVAAGDTAIRDRSAGMGEVRIEAGAVTGRRTGYVLGRAGMDRINAVEGIHINPTAHARGQDQDRRALSPDARRREIIDAHRPKR